MDDDTILTDFLHALIEDREQEGIQPLEHYLARFPGQGELIAREYLAFKAREAAAEEGVTQSTDRLGPYQLRKEIGRGGQGIVYEATDTRLGRRVALKVLKGLGPGSEMLLERFRREATVAAKLEHPGICAVHETGIIDGVPYIAMRFVDGESLSSRIKTSKAGIASEDTSVLVDLETERRAGLAEATTDPSPTPSGPTGRADLMRAVSLIEKAARALHIAHEAGIIHRDIKPGNIMITKEGDPVILDFGLARGEDEDLPSLTQSGDLMGTPAYMSPEQIAATRIRLDRRTDVYSLGVVLYECLTLQRPFDSPTREGLYQAILSKDPPDPRNLNTAVPSDLRVVLETVLEKDRDRRYQTALELAEELRRVREYEPIHARPITRWLKVKRWAQRNPMAAAGVTAAFLALAIGFAFSLTFYFEARNEAAKTSRALTELSAESAARQVALENLQDEQRRTRELLEEKQVALRRSEGLRLVPAAERVLQDDPVLAFLLAREAQERAPGLETNRALRRASSALPVARVVRAHESVICLAFDDHSNTIISGGREGLVKIWRPGDGSEVASLEGHAGAITAVTALPGSTRVISGAADGSVRLWDVAKREEVLVIEGRGNVLALAADEQTGTVTVVRPHGFTVRDLKSGKIVQTQAADAPIKQVALSPRGRRAVVWSAEKTVVAHVVEVATGAEVRLGMEVTCATFTDDGRWICAPAGDLGRPVITVAGADTGRPLGGAPRFILESPFVATIAAKPQGLGGRWKPVGTGSAVGVCAVYLDGPEHVQLVEAILSDQTPYFSSIRLGSQPGRPTCASFAGTPHRFVTGGANGELWFWDLNSGRDKTALSTLWGLQSFSVNRRGTHLAAANQKGGDYHHRVWDLRTEEPFREAVLETTSTRSAIVWGRDGARVLLGDRIHEVGSGRSWPRARPQAPLQSLSPGLRWRVAEDPELTFEPVDGTSRIAGLGTASTMVSGRVISGTDQGILFDASDDRVAFTTLSGARVCDLREGKVLVEIAGGNLIGFSSKASHVAVSLGEFPGGKVAIHEIPSGRVVAEVPCDIVHPLDSTGHYLFCARETTTERPLLSVIDLWTGRVIASTRVSSAYTDTLGLIVAPNQGMLLVEEGRGVLTGIAISGPEAGKRLFESKLHDQPGLSVFSRPSHQPAQDIIAEDGRLLVGTVDSPLVPGEATTYDRLRILDVASGDVVDTIESRIRQAAWADGGRAIVALFADGLRIFPSKVDAKGIAEALRGLVLEELETYELVTREDVRQFEQRWQDLLIAPDDARLEIPDQHLEQTGKRFAEQLQRKAKWWRSFRRDCAWRVLTMPSWAPGSSDAYAVRLHDHLNARREKGLADLEGRLLWAASLYRRGAVGRARTELEALPEEGLPEFARACRHLWLALAHNALDESERAAAAIAAAESIAMGLEDPLSASRVRSLQAEAREALAAGPERAR